MTTEHTGLVPAAGAGTAAQAGAETVEEPSVIDGDLPAQDTFDREYVTKLRGEAGRYRTSARDSEQYIEKLGGKEYVEKLVESTRTPQGVFNLWMEASKALGLNQQQIEALIGGEATPGAPAAAAKPDDDEAPYVTKQDLEELVKSLRGEVQTQRTEDLAVQGERLIYDTLDGLGVSSDEDRKLVIRFAEEFAPGPGDPREFDPEALRTAVRQGYDAFNKLGERLAKQYLDRKEDATLVPGALGGSAPGLQLAEEPKDTRHASKLMRELLSRQE